ncbi:MAG: 16S rRNA (guanine(527)-N(7))-methyltransferase RsmG, partial [Bacillota bacterium]
MRGEREKELALREAAAAFGVELDGVAAAKMVALLAMVGRANERFRLTAITAWEEALAKHLLDSLAPLALGLMPAAEGRAADLGSGGGFPGLVLAIVLPRVSFTLIEATQKKAAFLATAAEELGLANVRVWAARAEEVGRTQGREAFPLVTARAVAPLPVLLELAHPL